VQLQLDRCSSTTIVSFVQPCHNKLCFGHPCIAQTIHAYGAGSIVPPYLVPRGYNGATQYFVELPQFGKCACKVMRSLNFHYKWHRRTETESAGRRWRFIVLQFVSHVSAQHEPRILLFIVLNMFQLPRQHSLPRHSQQRTHKLWSTTLHGHFLRNA
jgi:hypothetical protein